MHAWSRYETGHDIALYEFRLRLSCPGLRVLHSSVPPEPYHTST